MALEAKSATSRLLSSGLIAEAPGSIADKVPAVSEAVAMILRLEGLRERETLRFPKLFHKSKIIRQELRSAC